MELIAKAFIQINKPITTVFNAITKKEHITQYFIGNSDGDMEEGKTLQWEFADFPGAFPVTILKVIPHQELQFTWEKDTTVKITFEAQTPTDTVVNISEGSRQLNEENLDWVVSSTGGWTNFLACLKAYMEYNINLRKGAFDYLNCDS
jgi:uncharacterized protein YndB with AHSA1/START domain